MMACGNKLVQPRLMPSQVMDGQTLHQVYGQKVVYLQPEVKIEEELDQKPATASLHDEVRCWF